MDNKPTSQSMDPKIWTFLMMSWSTLFWWHQEVKILNLFSTMVDAVLYLFFDYMKC